MAEFVGFERWAPGHAWGDAILADGTRLPIEDPSGEEERRIRGLARPETASQPAGDSPLTQAAAAAGIQLKTRAPEQGLLGGNALAMPAASPVGPPAPPGGVNPLAGIGDATPPTLPPRTGTVPIGAMGGRGTLGKSSAGPQDDPMQAAAQASGLQLVRTPGTPGGFQPSARSTQVQGPANEDRGAYLSRVDAANDARTQAGELGIEADSNAALRDAMRASVGAAEARGKIAEIKGKLAENERIRKITSDKMIAASKRPENAAALFEESPAFFTIFAVLASLTGGLAQGASGGRIDNTGLRTVFELMDMDVQAQRQNKSAILSDYERQLGDLDAATNLLRADMSEALARELDAMKRGDTAADVLARREQVRKLLFADAQDRRAAAEASVMRQVASQESQRYAPPTSGGVQLVNPTMQQLETLGIDEDGWRKFTTEKAGDLPGAASIVNGVQTLTGRLQMLQALADAYDGTIPGTGVIDFNRNDTVRNLGARLGYQGNVDASVFKQEEAKQLLEAQALIKGIPSDRDTQIIRDVVGASTTKGLERGVAYFKDQAEKQLRARAQVFPGREQQAVDILMGRMQATPGVRAAPSLRPR